MLQLYNYISTSVYKTSKPESQFKYTIARGGEKEENIGVKKEAHVGN